MKNVLITGGTRGIGKSTAKLFFEKGYRVFCVYKNDDESAKNLKSEMDCITIKADVCDEGQVIKLVRDIIAEYGSIDVLVNNAGISEQNLFLDISFNQWKSMIDTNLNSLYNVTHAVIGEMLKNHRGSIVNVSSIWGECGASCEVHYSAAKAGVIGFTKALAKEVGLSGIRVNCVTPGIINTDMNKNLSSDDVLEIIDEIPLRRVGDPLECAKLIYFLSSDDASYITGQTIGVNGGWNV